MPDDENAGHPSEAHPEAPLDRQAYLRDIRRELLKNLGLPENTKPEQVSRILAIKAGLGTLKKSGDSTA
jgi:hypothetical protein